MNPSLKLHHPFSVRSYADALAASLADSSMFLSAAHWTTPDALDEFAIFRSDLHSADLSLSAAEARHGVELGRQKWLRDMFLTNARWSQIEFSPYPILPLLCNAAEALLRPDGRDFILAVDSDEPGREILRWRFVSLAMPASILIAAAAARFGRAAPAAVRLLHGSMAPDQPVAQQHLHHAAAISFEEIWASLRLRALLTPGDFQRSLRDKRAWCPGLHAGACHRSRDNAKEEVRRRPERSARHMDEWGDLLFNAFIARDLLERHARHAGKLSECAHDPCRRGRTTLRGFLRGRLPSRGVTGTPYPWPADKYRIGGRYREAMAPHRLRRSQRERRALLRQQAAEERGIVTRAFRRAEAEADQDYELLLLQYLRVKTALHRILVHPAGEHGLKNFLDHFLQIKVYEPKSDKLRPARPVEPGLDVRSTEYRVAPDAWLEALGGSETEIEELDPGQRPGEAAWLIHFKRCGADDRLPLFGRAVQEMELEADRIGNALEQKPERLRRLRGIDICGVEEDQPLWVSAETLRKLRKRSCDIAARRPGRNLEPLRLTLHAGEDFRWLTSGMRAVAEPFVWKLVQRGDRIGHGIAVTLEPTAWWQRHSGQVKKGKRIDRLQDLGFLARYTVELPGARDDNEERFAAGRTREEQQWLEREVRKVLLDLGLVEANDATPGSELIESATEFWREIGTRPGRRLLQQPNAPRTSPPHRTWLHRFFWSRAVQRRALAAISLPVDASTHLERDLLAKARLRLVRELARWQIPIESNPSSNLVVASLDAVASQDFLAQSPHEKRGPGKETLPWTISTDDPITFATSLADEYAYAWAGMVLREKDPFDPAHARALLEEAAATSMRTRFTCPLEAEGPRLKRRAF